MESLIKKTCFLFPTVKHNTPFFHSPSPTSCAWQSHNIQRHYNQHSHWINIWMIRGHVSFYSCRGEYDNASAFSVFSWRFRIFVFEWANAAILTAVVTVDVIPSFSWFHSNRCCPHRRGADYTPTKHWSSNSLCWCKQLKSINRSNSRSFRGFW